MDTGKLYIVATPIGNLEDITKRAERILGEVDMIAAEDTRHTAGLLNSLGIKKRLISFHEHSDVSRAEELIGYLKEGKSIALVTDAGTPIVSDPGEVLTKLAAKEGIELLPIPGPCAAVAALCVSALDGAKFVFEGFLPRDRTRKEAMERALSHEYTTILYESPHNLKKTLQELCDIAPERSAALCKELTKVYESKIRGTLGEILNTIANVDEIKGEYVLVISGAPKNIKTAPTDEQIVALLNKCIDGGMKKKAAVSMVCDILGAAKNKVYELSLEL